MRIEKLGTFELETLARFLLHHMPMETRRKLVTQYPVIYRKLLDREITNDVLEAIRVAALGEI